MSDVLIKNMKMPNNCMACPMVTGYELSNGEKIINSSVFCKLKKEFRPIGEKYLPDCPLIPVPPHGRLIDADAFLDLVNDSMILTDGFINTVNALICGEPTVIEAEEAHDES